jgi:hypothetical protein
LSPISHAVRFIAGEDNENPGCCNIALPQGCCRAHFSLSPGVEAAAMSMILLVPVSAISTETRRGSPLQAG